MKRLRHRWLALLGGLVVAASGLALTSVTAADPGGGNGQGDGAATTTPIKHLVVIFDENVSFDHYFGTYPYATNPSGEPQFTASPDTPTVNNLVNQSTPAGPTGPLLTNNPNESNPLRLDNADPMTCDQDHNYKDEQSAADHGAEDMFVQDTGNVTMGVKIKLPACLTSGETNPPNDTNNYAVMDYYDGNTVTALWNYAQHFSMSDNAWTTTFGPSTPGALNATSAQTYGAICGPGSATYTPPSACTAPTGLDPTSPTTVLASNITAPSTQAPAGTGTDYGDADPTYDICSYLPRANGGDGDSAASTMTMGGNNIGEELTTAGLTWGWFQGGFDDGYVPGQGTQPTTAQICSEKHPNHGGSLVNDYSPHHEPFQYYSSTANPMHLPPTSVAMVGHNDQANHQYDTQDFWAAANSGNLPDVSYLKAPEYQDGHAGYSDPLDEQTWLVNTINGLEALPTWKSTAVVVTYDDSDGWYDHVLGPILTGSQTTLDTLTGANQCGSNVPQTTATPPVNEQARCGVGTRVPFLVVSRYSGRNKVSDSLIDQSSIVKFIESNWSLNPMGNGASDSAAGSLDSLFNFGGGPPAPPLTLDPTTGEPVG